MGCEARALRHYANLLTYDELVLGEEPKRERPPEIGFDAIPLRTTLDFRHAGCTLQ